MKSKTLFVFVSLLIVLSMLLGACTPKAEEPTTAEEPAEEAAPVEEETAAEETAEEEAAVEEPVEEAEPTTFVFGVTVEPDTLDPHKTGSGISSIIMSYLGSSLLMIDENGDYHPYLAESWDVSEDGLVYTFNLRQDILFHDGTPLTAHDFAFTYTRALDPEIASPSAGPTLGPVVSAEADDDYTFVVTLAEPYFPFLFSMCDPSYLMPLSQAYVEASDENALARNPIGVGPYKISEWVTGGHVLLEKNPDFNWGASNWENTGSWQMDYLEFRIIPELATIVAGLESGEIDFANIEPKDKAIFDELGFNVLETPQQGLRPYVALQTSIPPLDELNVRKALNMAINREAALQLLVQGNGEVQYGPLSSSQVGYWEGVEDFGYPYDPEGAKALLEESGFALNADDIYERDGEALSFTLYTLPIENWVKAAEVTQSMLKDIGVQVEIEQDEQGVVIPKILGGEYKMTLFGITFAEADIMYLMFHSSQIGGFNYAFVDEPDLDEILNRTRASVDPEARQQAVNEAQQYIAENAYFIPMYAPINFSVMNPRVKGFSQNPFSSVGFDLESAYIEE